MSARIDTTALRQAVLALPELAGWPEVTGIFAARGDEVRLDWQLPALACVAVGGEEETALPGVAAVACLQISIIMTDDMLDQDPRGEYHRLGYGRTANIALAFQSAALAVLARAGVPPQQLAAANAALAHAALATSYGQDLDVQNLAGEENYWRVVQAKSTPFYGLGLQLGALLGGASAEVADRLYQVGAQLGKMIQIFDDLADAFALPANPDWREGRNNLVLLYAASAAHAQAEEFRSLLGHVEDPQTLRRAQDILISSGATSYCVYLLLREYRSACQVVESLDLPRPAPLLDLLQRQLAPLAVLLKKVGLALPADLAELVA